MTGCLLSWLLGYKHGHSWGTVTIGLTQKINNNILSESLLLSTSSFILQHLTSSSPDFITAAAGGRFTTKCEEKVTDSAAP